MSTLFSPGNMTSRTAPSPYVISCSDYGTRDCWYAFTGVNTWNNNTTLPQWIQLYLGDGSFQWILESYEIYAYHGSDSPTAWSIQGSNDGTNWTTLDTQSGQDFTVEDPISYDVSESSVGYTYFRMNITAKTSEYLNIYTISLFGTIVPIRVYHPKKTNFYNPFPILGGV